MATGPFLLTSAKPWATRTRGTPPPKKKRESDMYTLFVIFVHPLRDVSYWLPIHLLIEVNVSECL